MKRKYLSKCCNAPAKPKFSDFPDFPGDDIEKQKIGTCWFMCKKCNKPCDVIYNAKF